MKKAEKLTVTPDNTGEEIKDVDLEKAQSMTKNRLEVRVDDSKTVTKAQEFVSYEFPPDELKELSSELAKTTQEKAELVAEKKSVTSEFSAKINSADATIQSLANKVTSGREMRYVDVEITMNTPEIGKKQCKRIDTGEEVWTKKMNSDESQLKLHLDEKVVASAIVEHSKDDDNNDNDIF